jgi:hypothetical protein
VQFGSNDAAVKSAFDSQMHRMLPPSFNRHKMRVDENFRNLSSLASSAIRMCFGDMVIDVGVSSCFPSHTAIDGRHS